jgi:hypothetical protein
MKSRSILRREALMQGKDIPQFPAKPDALREVATALIDEIDNGLVSGTRDRREAIHNRIRAALQKGE